MTVHQPSASLHGLLCPKCQSLDLRTLETRPADGGVKRRRECETCGHRFSTLEMAKANDPRPVVVAARKLIDAVGFDVNGIEGRGGNGGLTSTETVRASDELRLAIYRFEREGGDDR